MNEYRYILASNKFPKLDCPYCSAKKHWQRYIDTETGEVLHSEYGRCDNKSKCGAWVDPYKTGYASEVWQQEHDFNSNASDSIRPRAKANWHMAQAAQVAQQEPVYFDTEAFRATLQGYEGNTFIQNLLSRVPFPFEAGGIERVISLYRIGTISGGYMAGAVTFPFIDETGNVRAVQVKQFDQRNHTTKTSFLHSILERNYTDENKPLPPWLQAYTAQGKLVSCLFGSHLIGKYPDNPVALTEAPKTAIYGALYFGFPQQHKNLLWLAVYNAGSFTFDKLKALKGREVYVFPDTSKDGRTFAEWQRKAKEFETRLPGTRFIFSDLLEKYATPEQRENGVDIADILINHDWQQFRKRNIQEQPTLEPVKSVAPETKVFSQVEPLPKPVCPGSEILAEGIKFPATDNETTRYLRTFTSQELMQITDRQLNNMAKFYHRSLNDIEELYRQVALN